MGVVQDTLNPLEGYLSALTRDTVKGWYELEVGIPTKWVYDENKDIKCEVVAEDNNYRMLKIYPKNNKMTVDDLINFFEVIIETNNKIVEKEKEFQERMKLIKAELEVEAKKFYKELDSLKENSFKNVNSNFEKKQQEKKVKVSGTEKKRGRPPFKSTTLKQEVPKNNTPVIINNSDGEETTN